MASDASAETRDTIRNLISEVGFKNGGWGEEIKEEGGKINRNEVKWLQMMNWCSKH